MALQPTRLQEIVGNKAFAGRGLLARFLYLRPVSRVGYRVSKPKPMEASTEDNWSSLLFDLLGEAPGRDEQGEYIPHIVRLTPGADRAITSFRDELEPLRRAGERFSSSAGEVLASWVNKLDGNAARIAFALHAANNPKTCWKSPIAQGTMEAAITIARTLVEHAEASFDELGQSPSAGRGRRILAELVKQRVLVFTARAVFEWLRDRKAFASVDAVKSSLRQLEALGYVAEVHVPPTDFSKPQGGRPSTVYAINPFAYKKDPEAFRLPAKPKTEEETPARTAESKRNSTVCKPGFVVPFAHAEAVAALEDDTHVPNGEV